MSLCPSENSTVGVGVGGGSGWGGDRVQIVLRRLLLRRKQVLVGFEEKNLIGSNAIKAQKSLIS